MSGNDRARIILHGGIVITVGLLCGLPTTVEQISGNERHWHTAHEALIMMGIWMLVASSYMDALALERRERTAFLWSLMGMGYAFAIALVLGGIANVDAFDPGHTPLHFAVFLAALAGIFGAVMTAAITIKGALAAIRAARTGGSEP